MTTPIKYRRTVVVNQAMADGTTFYLNLAQQVGFQARYVIIRQLLYSNVSAGTDNGIYLISSNMSPPGNIGAVYIGIQGIALTPESIFSLDPYQQDIQFTVTSANAAF